MWDWLSRLGELPRVPHHVMMMHYALFIDEIDEPGFEISDPGEYFDWYFGIDPPHRARMFEAFKAAAVDVVFSGHIHCRRPARTVDGIRFCKGASTAFGQWADRWPDGDATLGFYRVDVGDGGLRETFVPLEAVSSAAGAYGPGGHPPPEERHYPAASGT